MQSKHPIPIALVILAILAMVGLAARDAGAVPATVSFTGRLTTANGPVSGNVSIVFTLYTQALAGTSVWSETRPNLAAQGGLVYADLGALTTLDAGILDNSQLFLEISIGGETLSPRLPLQSVPYAIRAEVANSADTLGTIAPVDVITVVNGGGGITATRSGNSVTLGASNAIWQSRVTGTCAPGSSIASITAAGTVTCELDTDTDTNTTYSAAPGGGLSLAGTAFGLSPCPAGQVLTAGAAGTWACAADAGVSGVTAGSGLTGGGTGGNVTLALATSGVATAHIADGAVTMAKTSAPAGSFEVRVFDPPSFPWLITTAAATFTPNSNGHCVVSVVGNTGEASPSGWAAFAGGLRPVGSSLPLTTLGDVFTAVPGHNLHSASATHGYAVTAGTTYEVGCIVNVSGATSSFADNTFGCDATWICN